MDQCVLRLTREELYEKVWSRSVWSLAKEWGISDVDWQRSANGITYPDLVSDIGQKDNVARRSLLKMEPDYTVEFLWIMSGYKASTCDVIQELMRPKPIRELVLRHETRVKELIETFQHEPRTG